MSYMEAKQKYAALGIDTDAAIAKLKTVPVALHCWQGDDVGGFDQKDKALSGGIQTTGNYPGKATTPAELMQDIDKVIELVPGTVKLNLHASYAIFDEENGGWVDRDRLEPKHFKKWVDFCRARGIGCDFNPTFFGHPMCDPLTLSSPNEETRRFWVEHGKASVRISQYLADELGYPCVMNIWAGDGYKDIPADRLGPRQRYKQSFDEILSEPFDKTKVFPCAESKVFGIGVESYTVGSAEWCLKYAAGRDDCITLMDNGHYHPTEVVSDKISAVLTYDERMALHVTRGVRWDSDHVVLFDDETKEICKEIVRCNALDRVFIALDYFDASINRIGAWVTGFRNLQKALLFALLQPNDRMTEMQNKGDFGALMALAEELKTYPFGEVFEEYCRVCGKPVDGEWYPLIVDYEKEILSKRGN
ncbi:MAG: L-rhamnose isomerase [Ruminococcaceae bacterium]|nr:L-rhamnose isomerase [Oscillospiraceae bacterium]